MSSLLSAEAKKLKAVSMTECCQLREIKLDEEDSWVELGVPPSRGSLCSSIGWTMGAGGTGGRSHYRSVPASQRHSRHSPKSLASPNVELATDMEKVKYRICRDVLSWDLSSRMEAVPPKEYRAACTHGESLSTPPNSPCGTLSSTVHSLRHSDIVKSPMFRVELLFGIVVSNLVTFLLGACIGFFLCKRIEKKTM